MNDYVYYIGDYWFNNNIIFKITHVQRDNLVGNLYVKNTFITHINFRYLKILHLHKEWKKLNLCNEFGLFCYNCNIFYNNAPSNIVSRIRGNDFICWKCDDRI